MRFAPLRSPEDVIALVREIGFLPLFRNEIDGFSIEDNCPPDIWFVEGVDGPWEWKGPIARSKTCAYGKFFGGRAGYVSVKWLPDFANDRRDGYDFEGMYEDGLVRRKDKEIYDALTAHGSLLSKELKRLCDYRKGGNKGFDAVITRMQMQTFVTIADFEYMRDAYGKEYGWGVARYATPELLFGEELLAAADSRDPRASHQRILEHLRRLLPDADPAAIERLIAR